VVTFHSLTPNRSQQSASFRCATGGSVGCRWCSSRGTACRAPLALAFSGASSRCSIGVRVGWCGVSRYAAIFDVMTSCRGDACVAPTDRASKHNPCRRVRRTTAMLPHSHRSEVRPPAAPPASPVWSTAATAPVPDASRTAARPVSRSLEYNSHAAAQPSLGDTRPPAALTPASPVWSAASTAPVARCVSYRSTTRVAKFGVRQPCCRVAIAWRYAATRSAYPCLTGMEYSFHRACYQIRVVTLCKTNFNTLNHARR
jgi:hypothetical protein